MKIVPIPDAPKLKRIKLEKQNVNILHYVKILHYN